MSQWLQLVSYTFGGAFMANAVPHVVSGACGRPFQSPFAKPPGKGLSSSVVNAAWGCFNLAVAYLLIVRVGRFDLRSTEHAAALGAGFILLSVFSAHNFGQFHGGRAPIEQGTAATAPRHPSAEQRDAEIEQRRAPAEQSRLPAEQSVTPAAADRASAEQGPGSAEQGRAT